MSRDVREKRFCKLLSEETLKEAIDNTSGTPDTVRDWLSVNGQGSFAPMTIKKQIEHYGLDAYVRNRDIALYSKSMWNIAQAINEGDVATSKWFLSYLLRKEQFRQILEKAAGANENANPLNIEWSGGGLTRQQLITASEVIASNVSEQIE